MNDNVLSTSFTPAKSILVFGEILFDLIKQAGDPAISPAKEVPGGAPGNFAYRVLSRLSAASELKVKMISSVGVDPRGDQILALLNEKGFDVSSIQRNQKYPTGLVDVTRHASGDATYVIRKGAAYDYVELTPDLKALAADAKLFYFGSLVQREQEGSRQTLAAMLDLTRPEVIKFVDINLRDLCYSKETIAWSVKQATVLKLNDEEVKTVAEAIGIDIINPRGFAAALAQRDQKTVLVTLGAKGALLAYPEKSGVSVLYEPGYKLDLKNRGDTVGCGDSFGAVFAESMLQGLDLKTCLVRANEIGAAVALTNGGMSPINESHLREVRSAIRNVEIALTP